MGQECLKSMEDNSLPYSHPLKTHPKTISRSTLI